MIEGRANDGHPSEPPVVAEEEKSVEFLERLEQGRTLDFLVIGAQRAGTTSLWQYLSSHPELYPSPGKEIPFFSHDERYTLGLDWYIGKYFATAPPSAQWGTVSPHYMLGSKDVNVELMAERIKEHVPNVRLVAILRDPVERAFSEYRLLTTAKREQRSFAEAITTQLKPKWLEEARRTVRKTGNYVVQGEYGRILSVYLRHFPRDQLLVIFTSDLEQRPESTISLVYEHLGVDRDFRPENLGEHFHQGGRKRRIPVSAEEELQQFLIEHAWPLLPQVGGREIKRQFNFWFRQWNTQQEHQQGAAIDPNIRARLERHYRRDAVRLAQALVPWDWVHAQAPAGRGAAKPSEAPADQSAEHAA